MAELEISSDGEKGGCTHSNISETGTCSECGLNFKVFMNYRTKKQVGGSLQGFISDLDKYPLNDNIKNSAIHVFKEIGQPTHRKNKRSMMLYYCIYNGALEIEESLPSSYLAKMLGLTNSEAFRSIGMFSECQTGYKPPKVKVTASDRLKNLAESLNFSSDTVTLMVEWGKEILVKDPKIDKENPQKVAAGMLKYFMEKNGLSINESEIKKIVSYSPTTIKDVYNRIAEIDNS